MRHHVGENATIEYDREEQLWVGVIEYDNHSRFVTTSIELSQVVFNLADQDAIDLESFECSLRSDIEQVLVVVNRDAEDQ